MYRSAGGTSRLAMFPLALVILVAACGEKKSDSTASGSDLAGSITADGSSTVAPMAEIAAADFMAENPGVRIAVGTSGSGGGFEKFCIGETDLSDASRPMEPDEAANCEKNGVEYTEVQVANDGISVVVNSDNSWAECLTTDELRAIWEPAADGELTNWNQVDPSFPDEPIELFGPGTDSGTFDYFTGAINGEEGASRTDYTASEDDNVIVTGVSGTKGGLGYFGLSYLLENSDKLKGLEVDGGSGCVKPSSETVQAGDYAPLSRPLFIYPSADLLSRPEGLAYVRYFVDRSAEIAAEALFVPMTPEQQQASQNTIERVAKG